MSIKFTCPYCNNKIDLEKKATEKEADGLDLRVRCSKCGEWSVLQRVKEALRKLKIIESAIITDQNGGEHEIKLKN